MPIGYLISVVVFGLCTLCALRPLRQHGPLGTGIYVVGMVYNEMPVLAVGLAVVTALSTDHLLTPIGLVALGLLGVALVGQAVIVSRMLHSLDLPEQTMTDALGPGWRSEIDARYASDLSRTVPWFKVLLLPFLRRHRDVQRVKNISYTADGGRRHRLDLYRHRSQPSNCPVFVHFHGGRFVSGAKNRESLALLHRLASHGWLCLSANYRLQPKAQFPDYVVDAKQVLAWVRREGPAYGADPATVFVAGNSAGGYLATFAALTADQAEYQPGFADADTSVLGAVGLYGYYGRTEADRPESSPSAHLHPDAPPILLVHGDRDSVVPVEWAREFAQALTAASDQPVIYTELPGAQHTFDYFDTPRSRLIAHQIEAFTAWVRSRRDQNRQAARPLP